MRGVAGEAVELFARLAEDVVQRTIIPSIAEEVGEPERYAVDDHRASRQLVPAEELLFLDSCPLFTPVPLVPFDAEAELVVPDTCGGEIDGRRCLFHGHLLGKTALARAFATRDERDARAINHRAPFVYARHGVWRC